MSGLQEILSAVASGLLTGGTSAITAIYAFFRNIRNRVKALEDRLGSPTEPKTGLCFQLERVTGEMEHLSREIRSWEAAPPEWLLRSVRKMSAVDLDNLDRLRDQLNRCEHDLDQLRTRVDQCVDREVYHSDAARRVEELAKIREDLSAARGLLQGVLAVIGPAKPE